MAKNITQADGARKIALKHLHLSIVDQRAYWPSSAVTCVAETAVSPLWRRSLDSAGSNGGSRRVPVTTTISALPVGGFNGLAQKASPTV